MVTTSSILDPLQSEVEMIMTHQPATDLSQRVRQASAVIDRTVKAPTGAWLSSILYVMAGLLVVAGALTLTVELLRPVTVPAVLIGAACGILAYVLEVLSRIEYDLRMQHELTRQVVQKVQHALNEFSSAAEARTERSVQAAEQSNATLNDVLEATSYQNELTMQLIRRISRPTDAPQGTQTTPAARPASSGRPPATSSR